MVIKDTLTLEELQIKYSERSRVHLQYTHLDTPGVLTLGPILKFKLSPFNALFFRHFLFPHLACLGHYPLRVQMPSFQPARYYDKLVHITIVIAFPNKDVQK